MPESVGTRSVLLYFLADADQHSGRRYAIKLRGEEMQDGSYQFALEATDCIDAWATTFTYAQLESDVNKRSGFSSRDRAQLLGWLELAFSGTSVVVATLSQNNLKEVEGTYALNREGWDVLIGLPPTGATPLQRATDAQSRAWIIRDIVFPLVQLFSNVRQQLHDCEHGMKHEGVQNAINMIQTMGSGEQVAHPSVHIPNYKSTEKEEEKESAQKRQQQSKEDATGAVAVGRSLRQKVVPGHRGRGRGGRGVSINGTKIKGPAP